MMSTTTASRLSLPLKPTTQAAQQANGITPLSVTGETHINVSCGKYDLVLDTLVVRELDVDILAGTLFMTQNDVAIRPAKKQIILKGLEVVTYGASTDGDNLNCIRRSQAFLLRAPNQQSVILPGEYMELGTPCDLPADTTWALEPRYDTNRTVPVCHCPKLKRSYLWTATSGWSTTPMSQCWCPDMPICFKSVKCPQSPAPYQLLTKQMRLNTKQIYLNTPAPPHFLTFLSTQMVFYHLNVTRNLLTLTMHTTGCSIHKYLVTMVKVVTFRKW